METIFISGASSGIGKAIAVKFAEKLSLLNKQTTLFLTAKNISRLNETKEQCKQFGCNVIIHPCDLTSHTEISDLQSNYSKHLGNNIDCFIHAAGIGVFKDFKNITPTEFDELIAVNLKSTFFLTQFFFQKMISQNKGHLIYITSVASITPFLQSSLYCMTKYGQKGFLDVMRLYARKNNIRLTNIMPGAVLTPMWDKSPIRDADKMLLASDIAQTAFDAYSHKSYASVEDLVIRHVCGNLQDYLDEPTS